MRKVTEKRWEDEENWFSWVQLFEENIHAASIRGNQVILRFTSVLEKNMADFFHELLFEVCNSWKAVKKAFTD